MDLEKTLLANLLTLARAYAKARKLKLSQVAKRHYGSGRFFDKLKAGGSVSIHIYGKLVDAIRDDWPEDAEWPYLQRLVIKGPRRK